MRHKIYPFFGKRSSVSIQINHLKNNGLIQINFGVSAKIETGCGNVTGVMIAWLNASLRQMTERYGIAGASLPGEHVQSPG
ncbi:hypothetical protein [Candidatus Pantoea formicae]|uniref:hypothetical protein n=1 Tax=Candidatus Pantoea formicae TaxID=2608355 RepID=UPI003F50EBDE